MEPDYYEYKSTKGLLSLRRNENCPIYWDLFLDGFLIRSNYTDPYQVALDVSNGNFGNESLDELFNKIYVPSDIRQWRTFAGVYSTGNEKVQNN